MTTNNNAAPDLTRLPAPLDRDRYEALRHSVFDDPQIAVYRNQAGDFAFLDPLPSADYLHYEPRAEKLGLTGYKKQRAVFEHRLEQITDIVGAADSFLEIGTAEGGFLECLHNWSPDRRYIAIEPDGNTRAARAALPWLEDHVSTTQAIDSGCTADCIGMFHVFEHLIDPQPMLDDIRRLLKPGGRLLIEVPCLRDPLLAVYESDAYEAFYFQRQHPYVYTGASLGRVLEAADFTVEETRSYQRYGLENHLNWLRTGKPGGNPQYRALFAELETDYRHALEASGDSDTVFVIARPAS